MFKRFSVIATMLSFGAGVAVFMFLMLPAFSTNAAGTTYYVATTGNDGNPCTSASPCRTIQHGVDMASAGDTVIVRAGTYVESVTMSRSGSAGSPITVKANPGETVVWTSANTSSAYWLSGAVNAIDQSYFRVEGFTFRGSRGGNVIFIYNNDTDQATSPMVGIEIVNNIFDGNGHDGVASGGDLSTTIYWAGAGYGSSYSGSTVNSITGNTFTNNYGWHIWLNGSSDTRVADNTVTGAIGSMNNVSANMFSTAGVFFSSWGGTPSIGQRNIIENNDFGNYDTARTTDFEYSGVRCDTGGQKTIIRNNRIHDIQYGNTFGSSRFAYGIMLESWCNDNTVQNNVIYRLSLACITVGYEGVNVPVGNIIDGNVGYQCKKQGFTIGYGRSLTVRNNIFAENAADGGSQVNVRNVAVSQGGHVFRNNLYYKSGTSLVGVWNSSDEYYSAADLTLSQWNSSSGETSSKSADPLFVNPSAGDFHLQAASQAKGAGVGGIDMGAYPGGGGGGTPTPTPTPTPTSCTPVSGSLYLSDMCPTFQSNGWGPIEKDKSNGDSAAGDGTPLTLNGVTYAKGLGTHALADIRYALNGQYSSFQSDIGIDDAIDTDPFPGSNGSVVFQVYVDGVKQYDSGTMIGGSASTPTKSLNVSVANANELRLVVTDAGDGIDSDHADWANARLTSPSGPTACSLYTPSTQIPTGFGSPYDVVSSPNTNLMNVTCLNLTDAKLDLGKGDPLQYIYNQGYLFKTGGTNWTPINYTSAESLIAGAWYPKTATTNITMTSTELANPSYNLAYICSWTGAQWKCGCRDQACVQSYWEIQSFKR